MNSTVWGAALGWLTFFVFSLLEILLAFVLEESEVFVHFLQCVVLPVECMDHVVIFHIYLLINVKGFLDKVDELLHFDAEELIDLITKLLAQYLNPLLAWAVLTCATTFRTIVDILSPHWARSCGARLGICWVDAICLGSFITWIPLMASTLSVKFFISNRRLLEDICTCTE